MNAQMARRSRLSNVEALLECVVCFEIMARPIYHCEIGHTVCGSCKARFDKCPTCRVSFKGARNFLAEKLRDILDGDYPETPPPPPPPPPPTPPPRMSQRMMRPPLQLPLRRSPRLVNMFGCLAGKTGVTPRVRCHWRGPLNQLEDHVRRTHVRCLRNIGVADYFRPRKIDPDCVQESVTLLKSPRLLFWECFNFNPRSSEISHLVRKIGGQEEGGEYRVLIKYKSEDENYNIQAILNTPPVSEPIETARKHFEVLFLDRRNVKKLLANSLTFKYKLILIG
uniref:RING-type domain-containing protein n=1 Tax=Timema genevievae TaxID=629358 RepID=A0A7R9PNU0_TIMGE|nr:unnamed protein product [Timema genevievae]